MPTRFANYVEIDTSQLGQQGEQSEVAPDDSGLPSGGVAGQILALVSTGGNLVPVWIYQTQDFYVQYPGVLTSGQNIFNIKCARPLSFPAGFPGCYIDFGTAATNNVTFNITQNGNLIGTITIASGASVGVFNVAAQTVFATGDVFKITLVGAADPTLANGGLTLTCTR